MVWRFDTWHYPYEVGKELRTCELLCDAVMTESSDCAGNLPCFTMKSTCPNNGPCATVFHDGRNHCLGPLEPEDAGN